MHGVDTELIGQMLELGADTKMQDIDGNTPLHYAIDNDRVEIVDLFLKQFGLSEVCWGCCDELLLQDHQKDGTHILHRSLKHGSYKCLSLILSYYLSTKTSENEIELQKA